MERREEKVAREAREHTPGSADIAAGDRLQEW